MKLESKNDIENHHKTWLQSNLLTSIRFSDFDGPFQLHFSQFRFELSSYIMWSTFLTDIFQVFDLWFKGEYFIKQLNCTNRQAVTTLECLQQIEDWRTIRDVDMSKFGSDFSPIWGPVLDGEMVSSDTPPLEKMKTGEYLNYEVRTNQNPSFNWPMAW